MTSSSTTSSATSASFKTHHSVDVQLNDNLKINLTDKEDKQVFESIWQSPNMEDMRVIDLPRMDTKILQDLLAYYSLKY